MVLLSFSALMSLLLLPVSATTATNTDPTPASCKEEPILIIGGGLSGLAAARDLTERGCMVQVLEGRSRLGGRTFSQTDDEYPWAFEHDLGGAYQHGSSQANSITWLADRYGIKRTLSGGDTTYVGEFNKTVWIRPNGTRIPDDEVKEGWDLFDDWLLHSTEILAEKVNLPGRISTDDLLNSLSEELDLDCDQKSIVNWHIEEMFFEDMGINIEDFPKSGLDQQDAFWINTIKGEDYMIPGGMSQILNLFVIGDPARAAKGETKPLEIHLDHIVTHFEHGPTGCSVTYYERGFKNNLKTKSGSSCLSTIPLGVLQGDGRREADVSFHPELSQDKRQAINNRGLAHQHAALVQFEDPFWREKDPGMTSWRILEPTEDCVEGSSGTMLPVSHFENLSAELDFRNMNLNGLDPITIYACIREWDSGCTTNLAEMYAMFDSRFEVKGFDLVFWTDFVDGRSPASWIVSYRDWLYDSSSFFTDWIDVSAFKQDPDHYYLQFFYTTDGFWGEHVTDDVLINNAIECMEEYYGKGNVPDPIGFKRSQWDYDHYARGSFSTVHSESTDKEWFDLARPESLSLYFAGEHTNYDGRYQTLDGAYNTGIREAERIAARPWNVNAGISQKSDWMNPYACTMGWKVSDIEIEIPDSSNIGNETKIPIDLAYYEAGMKERIEEADFD